MNFSFDKQGTAVDISAVLVQQHCFTPATQDFQRSWWSLSGYDAGS